MRWSIAAAFVIVTCRFVTENALTVAEVGLGVIGLVLAGMAAGRYVTSLARLTSKFYVRYSSSGSSSDVIGVRTAAAASTLTARQSSPTCRLC